MAETEKSIMEAGSFKEGARADQLSGFPDFFIKASTKIGEDSGALISFRAGQAPRLDPDIPVSPKPMSIKTKTCTTEQGIPLLAGYIAVDGKTFGRKGSDTDESVTEHNKEKLLHDGNQAEANKYSSCQLKIKWSELNNDIENGNYSATKTADGYLEFKPTHIKNDDFANANPGTRNELLFRVKLDDIMYDNKILSVEYRHTQNEKFKPLEVVGYEGHPITGDADMLAVLPSVSQLTKLDEITKGNLHKPFHAGKVDQDGTPSERMQLATLYLLMKSDLNNKPIDPKQMDRKIEKLFKKHPEIAASGIISPYELFVLLKVNKMVSKGFTSDSGAEKLIRHGAETGNPGKPSDLNGNIFHIWNGKTYLTENETQLRDFYLQADLLAKNYLPVHPKWNMEIWSPVIEKQIQLGQEKYIPPETLSNYRVHHALKSIEEEYNKANPDITKIALLSKEIDRPKLKEFYINLLKIDPAELAPLKNSSDDAIKMKEIPISNKIRQHNNSGGKLVNSGASLVSENFLIEFKNKLNAKHEIKSEIEAIVTPSNKMKNAFNTAGILANLPKGKINQTKEQLAQHLPEINGAPKIEESNKPKITFGLGTKSKSSDTIRSRLRPDDRQPTTKIKPD